MIEGYGMGGKVILTQHEKYVLVSVKGDPLSPKEIESTLVEATRQAVSSHLNLVIFRDSPPVKQRASTVDFYSYAVLLGKLQFRHKLALVFPGEMHRDNLDFFGMASKNRGINFRLFSKIDEALKWVSVGPSAT